MNRRAAYQDDAVVAHATTALVSAGHRVLQVHKLAGKDRAHVAALLELFAPPQGARVLDAGCGIGEIARLMNEIRPDLDFVLLNISPAQLTMCPPEFEQVVGDIEAMPVPDASFDAAMLCYSLGHCEPERALSEAARVLRPGGIVFIWDIAENLPNSVLETLGYEPHSVATVRSAGTLAGLSLDRIHWPHRTDAKEFAAILGVENYSTIFGGVTAVAYRMVKP